MPAPFHHLARITWRIIRNAGFLILATLLSPIWIPILLLLGTVIVFCSVIFIAFFVYSLRHKPPASQESPSPGRIRRGDSHSFSPIDLKPLTQLLDARAEADRLSALARVYPDDVGADAHIDDGPFSAEPWEDDDSVYMASIPASGGYIFPNTDSTPPDEYPAGRQSSYMSSESGSSRSRRHNSFIMTPEEVEEHKRWRASAASLTGSRSPPAVRTPAAMSSRSGSQSFDFGWDGTPPRRDSRRASVSMHRRANLSTTSLSSIPEKTKTAEDLSNDGLDQSA